MVFQNSLDYRLRLFEDHRIDFKALVEYQEYEYNNVNACSENFATDGLTNVDSGGANFDAEVKNFSDWMNISYLGMINYNYLDKGIFFDLTYRREGSSRFPADLRFGNFWAVGATWNIGRRHSSQA
ncbi:MAG: hypothetical protein R2756_01045 [Bacteroidales bacterium]